MLKIDRKKTEYIQEIVGMLSEKGINSFPIKIYNQSNAIDLVLSREKDWKKAVKILKEEGYKKSFSLGELRESHKQLYSGGDNIFSVHLHKNLSWNNVEFLNSREVWGRKVKQSGFYYPCPEDEASIIIVHSFFENRFIDPYDFFRYFEIKDRINLKEVEKNAGKFNWTKAYELFILRISKKEYNLRFSELAKASFSKLFLDIAHLRFRHILREMINCFFIDIFWCHRNKAKYMKKWKKYERGLKQI